MNCTHQQLTRLGVLLTVFILTAGNVLPLQAQTETVKGELTTASWLQTGYNAAHVGYNPK
jgi:hypothetical protein